VTRVVDNLLVGLASGKKLEVTAGVDPVLPQDEAGALLGERELQLLARTSRIGARVEEPEWHAPMVHGHVALVLVVHEVLDDLGLDFAHSLRLRLLRCGRVAWRDRHRRPLVVVARQRWVIAI